jgi:hypothetical protein
MNKLASSGSWMHTYSGKRLHPLGASPEEICIEDIAQGMALTCRFGGQCAKFYSVAQHCYHLSFAVPPEYALDALMHDAAEAYLTDVPSPAKDGLAEYQAVEDRLYAVIAQKFGLSFPVPEVVHIADKKIVVNEAEVVFNTIPDWVKGRSRLPLHYPINPVSWQTARKLWINRFEELTDER